MKLNIIYIYLLLLLYINLNYSIIIDKEGDHLFGYFSNLVYDVRNYTGQYEFVSINNECIEWRVIDFPRVKVFESRLSNNLVIAFKGTQSLSDVFSDLNWIPVDCHLSISCGKIRGGFLKEYNDVSKHLNQIMLSIDQPYNLYFTGHSLGGALAVLAAMDYINITNHNNNNYMKLKSKDYIKSVSLVTFGQPSVGNEQFKEFMVSNLNKLIYRRYVNINNYTGDGKIEYDPIATSIPTHPNKPILLNCIKNICPPFPIGLHFLDLYKNNLFNTHYTECNTNCKYYESNAQFNKFKYYHCPISKNSIISGSFNPKGIILHDKYSVCLFKSKIQFLNYSYRYSKSCHLRNKLSNQDSIIIDKVKSKKSFRKEVNDGEDLYIVVENHNLILPTSSFTYNISFSNPINKPNSPFNLTASVIKESNSTNTMDILIKFNSNNQHLSSSSSSSNTTTITYNIYLSQINNDWKKYQFKEYISLKSIERVIYNISSGVYSIVVSGDNGFESHASNYYIIYCNHCYKNNNNNNNNNNQNNNSTKTIITTYKNNNNHHNITNNNNNNNNTTTTTITTKTTKTSTIITKIYNK